MVDQCVAALHLWLHDPTSIFQGHSFWASWTFLLFSLRSGYHAISFRVGHARRSTGAKFECLIKQAATMSKSKSTPFVENPRTCLHESSPIPLNPNTAHIAHTTRKQKRPLDVAAFDNAMACAKSTDFCICAGTVTFKGRGDDIRVLVILNEKYTEDLWQLPKGRKNIGEDALCSTAIRETYEETGYKVKLVSTILLLLQFLVCRDLGMFQGTSL